MEGDKSESQEDNQISPKKSTSLEEIVEGLQQCVNEILEKIKQDKSFSEITAEMYDQKKIYLKTHLTELLQMYNVLVELVSSPGGSGFYISGAEDIENLLKKRYNLAEEIVSLIKKIRSFEDRNLKFDKQTRTESAYDAIRAETDYPEIEDAKVIALQKQVSDLQVENVRVLSSFDGVKEVINKLKLKVVELETEVDKQKGVLQDGA